MPNMKIKKSKNDEDAIGMEENPYPYGLSINLDADTMEKLGIDLMDVGSDVEFTASAKVTSISEQESEGSEKSQNMSLQITDMYIDKSHDSNVAKRFYGKDKPSHNSHNSHYKKDK
ncbi:MAG: hypothetical protein JKX96_07805 [Acinetobacter sp.]|nr:hypothetical protein [Acinetobacter sp.]